MARPRKADPTGKLAHERARRKLGQARQLLAGDRIMSHGRHHEGMALLKQLLGHDKPHACHCGDEQITLSFAPQPGSMAIYFGKHSSTGLPYLLSVSPDDYVWECHACNVLRDHARRAA